MPEIEEPLVLHCCCAPCAGGCVSCLVDRGRATELFFSNSNLMDELEFSLRLGSMRKLAELFHLELTVDPYDHQTWLNFISGLENEPEKGRRCSKCFEFSLRRTEEFVRNSGKKFATTLTVSPHKISEMIFAAGEKLPGFEKIDFKKGGNYATSCRIAKENLFYRQKFCGCEFSYISAGSPPREVK